MATQDVTKKPVECPCGEGKVTFVTSSPDHPWARASQTTYSATIDCENCRKTLAVHQEYSTGRPKIVYRAEVEAKNAIREQHRARAEAIGQSAEADRLRDEIIAVIDSQPSKAARHRKLADLGLARNAYGTYLKHPYGGEEALRFVEGARLAQIGSTTTLAGKDQEYFSKAVAELEKLEEAERAITLRPVSLT